MLMLPPTPQLPFSRPSYNRAHTDPFGLMGGACTPMGAATPSAHGFQTPRSAPFGDHTPRLPTFGGATPTAAFGAPPPQTPRAPTTPIRHLKRAATDFFDQAAGLRRAASRSASRVASRTRNATPRARAGSDWMGGGFNFADAVKGSGNKPQRILCYGDSLTAGFYNGGRCFEPYGQTLSQELGCIQGDACDVRVCGLSGKTAMELVHGLESPGMTDITGNVGKGLSRLLAEEGPYDLVIIMLGTNDLGQGHSPETILNSISQMHAACHRHGIPTVAMAPPTIDHGATRSGRNQLASLLAGWTKATQGVVAFVDCEEFCPRHDRALWEPDQLHLSPHGSQALGRRMARWVQKMSRQNALEFR
mmetsp:Transcript_11522/g.26733  ORF Transcript_11522/g.26733 Transcript_11522/m.26733 type:complete len:362 (+) Transcript_11522:132-1217(+)|eukprot:CAMPEP_0178407930 /NCGR_PEP_ID=MMETSP0689_2-20121128/19678_1 /TAXON_ID=160604 /ORGANISM="Amphidinium massartii, Strain CS-259" /LENGTH=361 /DNA_ID=CAMNT_0020029011 /DNA_START=126 /DNA_END=1211 /DNA_ORIENTATION=-